jgi:hypothetical protein
MEPRFGHDFSKIRVHTDATASESAEAVGALAYTVGRNIVFGKGQFCPQTAAGRMLLSHELTHSIQQRSFASTISPHQPIAIESPGTSLEQAAEKHGSLLPGRTGAIAPVPRLVLQRSPDTDPRWKNSVQAARYRGQIMANRIRKHGKLSKEARAKINQELAYFEGDAKETYKREVLPILRTTVEIEMPEIRFEKEVPSAPPVTSEKEAKEKKTGPEYAAAREYEAESDQLQKEWKPNQSTLSRKLKRWRCASITSPRGRANWSRSELRVRSCARTSTT